MPFGKNISKTPGYISEKQKRKARKNKPKNIKLEVMKIMRAVSEKKYIYNDFGAPTDIPNSATPPPVLDCTNIIQGLYDTNRIGDKVRLTSIEYNVQFYGDMNNVVSEVTYVRFIMFQWFDYNAPQWSDIMMSNEVLSPYTHDKRTNYRILLDKKFILTSAIGGVTTANDTSAKIVSGYITKFADPNVMYQGGSLTGNNKVYCFAMQSPIGGLGTGWKYHPVIKTNFRDV